MESMRQQQMIPGKLDNPTEAVVTSVRDRQVEKCLLASRVHHPSSAPAFKGRAAVESVETVETVENSEGDNADYEESVASECSVESNAPDDGGDSDADSPLAFEEKNIKRCPSGGSIVTYDQAASKLREDGECERTGDRKIARCSDGKEANGVEDDQEISINADQLMTKSTGPAWTDDKHCSYLNSIEQTFIQSLYGQDYQTVDAPGQDDQDCVESRPMYGVPSYGCELFTSMQRGCYNQKEYYKPQFKISTLPVFLSPWIQHFNPRGGAPGTGSASAGQDAETGHAASEFVDGTSGGNCGNADIKEVKETIPNLNDPPTDTQVPLSWSSRFQSQHNASTSASAHVREDVGIQPKKRNCNVDTMGDATYRPKKLKSNQCWLAEIDLDLEEEFVLKQEAELKASAKSSELKRVPRPFGGVNGGLDLNQELVDEDDTKAEDGSQAKTADFISQFKESSVRTGGRGKETASDVAMKKQPNEIRSDQDRSFSGVQFGRDFGARNSGGVKPLERDFGEGSSAEKNPVGATRYNARPPGIALKPVPAEDTNFNYGSDAGFDDEEEFEFLLRKSPRASKTYTWGGTIGPRRRLHTDCNVSVESAATHSGGVTRDCELPNKASCE